MKIQEVSPILWTKNIAETIAFYEELLGFKGNSNFPNFVSLAKDDTRIMFVVSRVDTKPTLTGSIYFFIEDVDGLWEQVKDRAKIKSPVTDREYLMRDFSILDNNGYELVFSQDISRK